MTTLDELVQTAQKMYAADRSVKGPDDHYPPRLLCSGPRGVGCFELGVLLATATGPDVVRWLTAAIVVARAEHAVLASPAFMLNTAVDESQPDVPPPPPDIPLHLADGSVEALCLICISTQSRIRVVYAPIVRYPDGPPTLDEWSQFDDESPQEQSHGAMSQAVKTGLWVVKKLPPAVVQAIDTAWDVGIQRALIRRFVESMRHVDITLDVARAKANEN